MATIDLWGYTVEVHLPDDPPAYDRRRGGHDPQNRAAAARADEVLAPIYERFRGWLVWLATSNGVPSQDAEDLVQESYLKARQGFHRIRKPESMGGWLKAVIVRKSLDYGRKRKAGKRRSVQFFADLDYNDRDQGPARFLETVIPAVEDADLVEQEESRQLLLRLLRELPPDQYA